MQSNGNKSRVNISIFLQLVYMWVSYGRYDKWPDFWCLKATPSYCLVVLEVRRVESAFMGSRKVLAGPPSPQRFYRKPSTWNFHAIHPQAEVKEDLCREQFECVWAALRRCECTLSLKRNLVLFFCLKVELVDSNGKFVIGFIYYLFKWLLFMLTCKMEMHESQA